MSNDEKTYKIDVKRTWFEDYWYIILNDTRVKNLLLFKVPEQDLKNYGLHHFRDKNEVTKGISIQTDEFIINPKRGSKVSPFDLKQYLVKEISYSKSSILIES